MTNKEKEKKEKNKKKGYDKSSSSESFKDKKEILDDLKTNMDKLKISSF